MAALGFRESERDGELKQYTYEAAYRFAPGLAVSLVTLQGPSGRCWGLPGVCWGFAGA